MYLICGEALFDFFLDGESGPGAAHFAARAGGSPFNVAVGLARLGADAALLTGLSTDMMGARLRRVLEEEGVDTSYLLATGRPTTLSLVGLDAAGSPAYAFYGENSADSGVLPEDLPALDRRVAGLHFGSYSIAVRPVADAFASLAAANAERFISLDPNVRPTIEPDMDIWRKRTVHLAGLANLVKISTEDLAALYPGRTSEDFAAEMTAQGTGLVVVTDGGRRAAGWTSTGLTASVEPPRTAVIDTVGAGDTFQAALLYRLGAGGDPASRIAGLDTDALERRLRFAATAAAITWSRRGADMPRLEEVGF
ncbi:MAG: carbohydrate kinase [Paracoccaceae bacterium]